MEDWRAVNSDGKAGFEYAPPYTATDLILKDLRKKEAEAETLIDQRRAALESAEDDLEYIRYKIEEAECGEAV